MARKTEPPAVKMVELTKDFRRRAKACVGAPVGYHNQKELRCCINCRFSNQWNDGFGDVVVCEIFGEPDDGTVGSVVDPSGICDAFKPKKGGKGDTEDEGDIDDEEDE